MLPCELDGEADAQRGRRRRGQAERGHLGGKTQLAAKHAPPHMANLCGAPARCGEEMGAWGQRDGSLHFLKLFKEVDQMLASYFLKRDKEVAQI